MGSENVEGFLVLFYCPSGRVTNPAASCDICDKQYRTAPDIGTAARLEKAESDIMSDIGLILTDIRHPNY
jgi:hypothetical protein